MSFSPIGNSTQDSIQRVFDSFNKLKVLVIGDSMIDTYLTGIVERMSPEAPVPIVNIQSEEHRLGGAANVALNLQALGAQVLLSSICGKDSGGDLFLQLLEEKNLSTEGISRLSDRPTTQKKRVMSGTKHLLRMDYEVTTLLSDQQANDFFKTLSRVIPQVDVIIIEDYDKGLLTQYLIEQIIKTARSHQIPVCVDPKFRNFHHYKGVSLFKPNLLEFRRAIGLEHSEGLDYDRLVAKLRADQGVGDVMLTLGAKGIFYQSETSSKLYSTIERPVADVSGAGDTVIAIAALTYVLGLSPHFIAELSNLGGGIVCESPGVVPIAKTRLMEEAMKAGLE